MPKDAKIYICETCDFSCSKKSNYDKHLSTRKHKNLTNPNKKDVKKYICVCGKEYKHAPTLSHHKKTCKYINNSEELEVSENNKELQEQNNILIEAVLNMGKDIKDLQSKIDNQPPTTTNIVNNFNLNVYLNETCKDALNLTDFVDSIQLQLNNLESMGKLGYVEGMSNLIITELNNLEKDKRPIHCSDAKRDVLYIKDNDTWEKDKNKEKIKQIIKKTSNKNYTALTNWTKANPNFMEDDSKQMFYAKAMSKLGKPIDDGIDDKIVKKICNETYVKDKLKDIDD